MLHIYAFLNESNFYTFFWRPKWMDIVENYIWIYIYKGWKG